MGVNSSNISVKHHSGMVATDFLRRDEKMAALLPAIERVASLQKDCANALPQMFKCCEILAFEDCQLTLSLPNTALAAKLKHQIPRLQATLALRGWQVHDIKIKVRITKPGEVKEQMRPLSLPQAAVIAFKELSGALKETPKNATLIAALKAMVARRRPR